MVCVFVVALCLSHRCRAGRPAVRSSFRWIRRIAHAHVTWQVSPTGKLVIGVSGCTHTATPFGVSRCAGTYNRPCTCSRWAWVCRRQYSLSKSDNIAHRCSRCRERLRPAMRETIHRLAQRPVPRQHCVRDLASDPPSAQLPTRRRCCPPGACCLPLSAYSR